MTGAFDVSATGGDTEIGAEGVRVGAWEQAPIKKHTASVEARKDTAAALARAATMRPAL